MRDDREEDKRQHRDDQEEEGRGRDSEWAGEVLPTQERCKQHRGSEETKVDPQLAPRKVGLVLEPAIVVLTF